MWLAKPGMLLHMHVTGSSGVKQLQLAQLTWMSTLNRGGRLRSSLVRMHSPMRVAMLQCSTVGVNSTLQPRQHRHIGGLVLLRGRHSCKQGAAAGQQHLLDVAGPVVHRDELLLNHVELL